jgi:uncharacterized OB-fold protein
MAQRRPDRVRGPGHDDFWAWCDQGELRIQQCAVCAKFTWPVRRDCEHCGAPDLAWTRMSGRGRVASWCTFERDYYQGLLPIPWDTVLVELEEGVLFISNPVQMTWRDLAPGLPVRLVFADCEDGRGPFRLPVFEKDESVADIISASQDGGSPLT